MPGSWSVRLQPLATVTWPRDPDALKAGKKCLKVSYTPCITLTIKTVNPVASQPAAAAAAARVGKKIVNFCIVFSRKIYREPKKDTFQNRKNKIVFSTKIYRDRLKNNDFASCFFRCNFIVVLQRYTENRCKPEIRGYIILR